MNRKYWKDFYVGDCCFYWGLLNIGDYRFGASLGNKESTIDLIFFTVGYFR